MKKSALILVSTLILTLALAACSAQPAPTSTSMPANTQAMPAATDISPTTAPTAAASSATEVAIANFAFNPASLTVKVGTTVKWTNSDSVAHTVTSDTGLFDSGDLSQGQSFSYTFTTAGTYPYHCTPHHAKMAGTVIVTN